MSKQAKSIAEQLRKQTENAVKDVVLGIDEKLRRYTPVGTGHARENWIPSVGAPFTGEASGQGEHDRGVAAVVAYKLEDGPAFESNNVPYIMKLNDGSSDQRPAGFVEQAIVETEAEARAKYADRNVPVDDGDA